MSGEGDRRILPFRAGEFQRRLDRVRERAADRSLDALVLNRPKTGHRVLTDEGAIGKPHAVV